MFCACGFIFRWHGNESFFTLAIEGIEKSHTENNGLSFGEDFLEFIELDFDLFDVTDSDFVGGFVTSVVRAGKSQIHVIRPMIFTANTDFLQGFDGVTNGRATVFVLSAFYLAGIVVDKETAGIKLDIGFGLKQVFYGTHSRIGGAAAKLTLVFDGRHIGTKIDLLGKL